MFCYVLGKTTVKDVFYLKFKLKISFGFRSLLEWEWLIRWQQSVVSIVQWYRISRSSYWVENLQLSFCLSILKAHMNLNCIQRLIYTILQTFWDICIFCGAIQYMSKKQQVGSAHVLSADSWEIVFDEGHFIVNLQSSLQPLALPRCTFPQSESFVHHSPSQNNFQNSSPLDTSETALEVVHKCISSEIADFLRYFLNPLPPSP